MAQQCPPPSQALTAGGMVSQPVARGQHISRDTTMFLDKQIVYSFRQTQQYI